MITTGPMSDDQFEAFLPLLAEGYAQDIAANAGLDIGQARRDAQEEIGLFLARGRETPGHFLLAVLSERTGELVGYLWWQLDAGKRQAFLFNLHVLEPCRGLGYGRAIMQFVDASARAQGATHVALNVFASNAVARALYASSGYTLTNMTLTKRL